MSTRFRAPCSEFPNDNPKLHSGAIWICRAPCERPVAETQSPPIAVVVEVAVDVPLEAAVAVDPALEDDDPGDIIIEELDDLAFEGDTLVIVGEENARAPRASEIVVVSHARASDVDDDEPRVEQAAADPFALLLRTLSEVALASAGPAAASVVGAILGESRLDARALSEAQVNALVEGAIMERVETGIVRASSFASTVIAWQALLRGETDDMGACGSRMLDEWSADIVARAIGVPAKMDQLRRELRSRGVAAFGLIDVAA